MENILLYLFILLLLSFLFSISTTRQYRELDTESKLKLIDINIYIRRIYIIGLLFIVAFYYIVIRLDLFEVDTPLAITVMLLFLITKFISNKKRQESGIPKTHEKYRYFKVVVYVILVALFVTYYYSEDTPKSANEFQYEAQDAMMAKHYAKAITSYTNALNLDSSNSNCLYNRGVCKYFSKDTIGACEDWYKAQQLGDEKAAGNVKNFCK